MGSEALLPQARGEFCDAAGGMHADALQDIDEVGVGIDVVQATSDDERLDDADMLGPSSVQQNNHDFLPMGITGSFCPYRAGS